MSTDKNKQSILNKQRLDKFRMVLTLPNVLHDIEDSDWNEINNELINLDSLQFSLYSATIPEISIPAILVPTYGQTVKVTSQTREPYAPITCRFSVDNRFRNYWVLWKWLEAMNHQIDSGVDDSLALTPNNGGGQIDNNADFLGYQTVISIYPLDEYTNEMCEFKFTHAFITKLSGIIFNYQDPSQVECEFTFDFGQMDLILK
jgi:hypothetical protein